LDQPEYPGFGHSVLEKPQQPFVVQVVEGNHDTLPIISTSRNASPSRGRITRLKGNLWKSCGKRECPPAYSSFSFYRTAVSR
jgi:hypothetical protein